METIIGKRLYSKMYGQGIITKEEDGIIWVDFLNKDKNNVCFQATASFAGEKPFLTSEDKSVLDYIQHRIEIEKDIQEQNDIIDNMKKIRINDACIEKYTLSKQIFLFTKDSIKAITVESEPYLYDSVQWFENGYKSKVYAVLAIPDIFNNKIFTYAFLERRHSLEVKGNLAFTFAYYLNPNCEHCGENRPLAIQITKNGFFALPDELSGFVWKYFEK